jgi:APA family basic amino acid/polyamine antiporter
MSFLNFFSSDYFGHYGWSDYRGCFFAFIGFDAVSTAAQEAKNPQKECQWYFRFISNLYYFICLFAYVLTGLENYLNFKGDASPVTTAFAKTGYF